MEGKVFLHSERRYCANFEPYFMLKYYIDTHCVQYCPLNEKLVNLCSNILLLFHLCLQKKNLFMKSVNI